MKLILLGLLLLVGCSKPSPYDINDPIFSYAKQERDELVAACGPGIIAGQKGENHCTYQVAMDSLFFQHPSQKTGLLHDPDWAYRDGVEWVTASTMIPAPNVFDLRELMKNGQPEIKQQQCGDCWAWASHHGYEISQAVHDGLVVDNSVQSVLSCSKQGSCGGGYMSAVDFIRNGLPLEAGFAYLNGTTGKCKFNTAELTAGWEPKMVGTPYIGSSLNYSRFLKTDDGFAAKPTVQEMRDISFQWKAPLVVTVSAYSASGDGIVNSCSAINSGGNHMVTIVGWDDESSQLNAHVWNSWGKAHGKDGVSRIKWECGAGKLNRGLGVSAKVVQYRTECKVPVAAMGPAKRMVMQGLSVKLGKKMAGQTCKWTPSEGLSDPNACETFATPSVNTEYHMVASNGCGTASTITLVEVWSPGGGRINDEVKTPHGTVTL
jgi:hypothetical protein